MNENLLEIKGIEFSYEKDKKFLENISFSVNEGDVLAIIGRNGSGKSTLVKIISRIINNYSGNVSYSGKDIKNYEHKEFSRNISYLPQV
ncbi:MAG: ABC transporter ATP-binding protein, partial [Ignavibacteria bacterium]|nr:ABC transporter ATP-binding protein [Ignavibacteria bacterium]